MKITISYYSTPKHRNFERAMTGGRGGGIQPDVAVPMSRGAEEALRQALSRYDVPERYRPPVEERRRRLGLPEEDPPDPELEAALDLLRRAAASPAPR